MSQTGSPHACLPGNAFGSLGNAISVTVTGCCFGCSCPWKSKLGNCLTHCLPIFSCLMKWEAVGGQTEVLEGKLGSKTAWECLEDREVGAVMVGMPLFGSSSPLLSLTSQMEWGLNAGVTPALACQAPRPPAIGGHATHATGHAQSSLGPVTTNLFTQKGRHEGHQANGRRSSHAPAWHGSCLPAMVAGEAWWGGGACLSPCHNNWGPPGLKSCLSVPSPAHSQPGGRRNKSHCLSPFSHLGKGIQPQPACRLEPVPVSSTHAWEWGHHCHAFGNSLGNVLSGGLELGSFPKQSVWGSSCLGGSVRGIPLPAAAPRLGGWSLGRCPVWEVSCLNVGKSAHTIKQAAPVPVMSSWYLGTAGRKGKVAQESVGRRLTGR